MRRLLLTLAILVAAGLGAACPAQASRLSFGSVCDKYMYCQYTATYAAAPGERNDVRVATSEEGFVFGVSISHENFAISDAGALIDAPASICTGAGSHLVTCTLMPGEGLVTITMQLGDGDDRADASGAPAASETLDGGPGNDVLHGGPATDTLIGGPGDDVLDGGGGVDVASYADHSDGVRADLRAGTATAAGGERDTLTGIEQLRGGPGDDVLAGDAGANDLRGGGGRDRILGRGGDDTLSGAGTLDGGDGNDRLRLQGKGRAICGAGANDIASAAGTSRVVDDSCESLRLLEVTVKLQMARHNPSEDELAIPILALYRGDKLHAHLSTTASPRRLGSRSRPIARDTARGSARLAFTASGAAYVRRHAPLDVVLNVGAAKRRIFGGNVTLRLHRH